jgi:ABC-type glycerol-3-phosphate transport system substrate-binding protein
MQGWVGGVYPNLASLGMVGGVRYGIPFGADLVHLAYRASLTVTTPITWGSVSGSGGRYLFVPGGFEGSWGNPLLLQYLGAGGALRDAQGQKTALDPTVLAQALALYKELYDSGVLPEDILSVTSADAAWALFAAGEAGFIEVAASEFLAEPIPGSAAFAAVPTLSGTPATTARGWVWVIPARSPDRQQAAVQFLDWVLAPERESLWCEAACCLAAASGAWLEKGSLSPHENLLVSLLQVAVPLPGSLDSTEAARALQDALTQVLTAGASPQQAAETLASALNK